MFVLTFQAANSKSAEEGILFMQEMVELSKSHSKQQDIKRQAVIVQAKSGTTIIKGGPAHFGRQLKDASVKVRLSISFIGKRNGAVF